MPKRTKWTKGEIDWFIKNYPNCGKKNSAQYLDRSLHAIRTRAFMLGIKSNCKYTPESNEARAAKLRGRKRPEHSKWLKEHRDLYNPSTIFNQETRNKISIGVKNAHKKGKYRHVVKNGRVASAETKSKMSLSIKAKWADPTSKFNSREFRQKKSDIMKVLSQNRPAFTMYSRAKMGWEEINGHKYFFRSSWEKIYAEYLQFLKDRKEIVEWLYEPQVFWFEKIKRGVRSYKPDFKVINNNGTEEFHEVKGYMDNKSKTKIKRMAIYYPKVKLIVIDKYAFKEIQKWEKLFNKKI